VKRDARVITKRLSPNELEMVKLFAVGIIISNMPGRSCRPNYCSYMRRIGVGSYCKTDPCPTLRQAYTYSLRTTRTFVTICLFC